MKKTTLYSTGSDDKRALESEDLISKLVDYIAPTDNTKIKILEEVQKTMSDAMKAIQDKTFSKGTYKILDVNETIIAYAWYDEDKKFVLQPVYEKAILSRRVN